MKVINPALDISDNFYFKYCIAVVSLILVIREGFPNIATAGSLLVAFCIEHKETKTEVSDVMMYHT